MTKWWNAPGMLGQPEEILALHNTKQGKRLFLVGNGASLLDDAALLEGFQDEDTWTCNGFMHWEARPFEPTFFAISEERHINRHGIGPYMGNPEFKAERFAIHWYKIRRKPFRWVSKAPEVTVMEAGMVGLDDELPPLPISFCTQFYGIQLGAWMGYEEFYLVGNEFSKAGYAWEPAAQRNFEERNGVRVEKSSALMKIQIERAGRKIIDCTPGGRLNEKGMLPFRPLSEVLR